LDFSGKELLPFKDVSGEYQVRFSGGTTLGQCAYLYAWAGLVVHPWWVENRCKSKKKKNLIFYKLTFFNGKMLMVHLCDKTFTSLFGFKSIISNFFCFKSNQSTDQATYKLTLDKKIYIINRIFLDKQYFWSFYLITFRKHSLSFLNSTFLFSNIFVAILIPT